MKKHSADEIRTKLGQADEMARHGQSQVEICKALGVSVMTFHRWRKLPIRRPETRFVSDGVEATASASMAIPSEGRSLQSRKRLEELRLENQQLRKIVTDLLLEKLKIEEAASKFGGVSSKSE